MKVSKELVIDFYIDDTDANGVDIQSYMRTIDDSTSTIKGHFRISNKLDSSQFLLFTISALSELLGILITISNVDFSASSPFSDAEELIITFARTGDKVILELKEVKVLR